MWISPHKLLGFLGRGFPFCSTQPSYSTTGHEPRTGYRSKCFNTGCQWLWISLDWVSSSFNLMELDLSQGHNAGRNGSNHWGCIDTVVLPSGDTPWVRSRCLGFNSWTHVIQQEDNVNFVWVEFVLNLTHCYLTYLLTLRRNQGTARPLDNVLYSIC